VLGDGGDISTNASRINFFAVPALVMVSWVVNVLEATKKRVVSGSHFFRISAM